MFRYFFLALLFSTASYSVAQVTTGVQATGKHAKVIENFKFLKSKKEKKERKIKDTKDKATVVKDTLSTLDSVNYSLNVRIPDDSISFSNPDFNPNVNTSAAAEESEHRAEELARQNGLTESESVGTQLNKEAPTAEFPKVKGMAGVDDLSAGSIPKMPPVNINPRAMNIERMSSLMDNIGFDKLETAHNSMSSLKKVYSEVPSVADSTHGIKKKSLKGQPLIERFFIGGNVSIPSTDPFAIDINLQTGFKIDKNWSIGLGVIWRETFESPNDSLTIAPGTHGWSSFTTYKFGKGFLAMAEFSTLQNKPILTESPGFVPWQNQYLLGIGRQFDIAGFLQMSTVFLYDFNFRHNDLHPRPFILRVGYTISKPHFKKKGGKRGE